MLSENKKLNNCIIRLEYVENQIRNMLEYQSLDHFVECPEKDVKDLRRQVKSIIKTLNNI
jgi:hypothetical protein